MFATAFNERSLHDEQESDVQAMVRLGAYGNSRHSSQRLVASPFGRGRPQPVEIGHWRALKRCLAPRIEDNLATERAALSGSRRREVTVLFSDLRGFTEFSGGSEPEAVLEVLKEYHAVMGQLVVKFHGTVAHMAGDGLMVLFNDTIPQGDHTERAMRMALEMRESARDLRDSWLQQNRQLDVGMGLATGLVALGNIGFGTRIAYTAVGQVTNLASRLCDAAKGGQILTDDKTADRVARSVHVEAIGRLELKGFSHPVNGFNVTRLSAA